ncbi:hypothetical protein [Microbispora sp. NPDC049125]|uniref:hypothetical protein n=1 Tax=Microbispora sp. NPDC049125 TaxID=3154929 RepID=UPI0034672D21
MRRLLTTAALLALAAGCAQSPSTDGVASVKRTQSATAQASASPTAPMDPEEQGRKYAQCMRSNGVNMSDPEPNGKGGFRLSITGSKSEVDRAKVDKAANACRALDPGRGKGGPVAPEDLERARAFAKCMRDHGVDMPDPDSSGRSEGLPPSKLKDPKVNQAMRTCRSAAGEPGKTK